MAVRSASGAVKPLDPELLQKLRPVTLTKEQILEVPEALTPLFPFGGLQRGWSVGVAGPAAWAVAMAMVAPGLGDEGWMAVVGVHELNLAMAAQMGVRLDRLLVVESPGSGRLATVLAALLETVQVVVLAPGAPVSARDARRLSARLREQQANMIHLDGGTSWPTGLDLELNATTSRWHGLGNGHGYLQHRSVTVTATGRRGAARPRQVQLELGEQLIAAEPLAEIHEFKR